MVIKIIDNIVYLEAELEKITKLPFIQYEKGNPYKQKQLPASKLYVSLSQQYNLALKTFDALIGGNTEEDNSPLRAYLKNLMEA